MEFEKGNGMVKPELLEERIFNSITWAPRIWGPWDNLFDCRDRYAEYDWGFSYGYWSGSKQIKEDELSETAIYSNYFWYIYHIRTSCRVEQCSTRHEIYLSKKKAFFE